MRPRIAVLVACAAFPGAGSPANAGDPARGERIFQYCYACHSVMPGETNLQGPNLAGIIGQPIAAQDDFDYSLAMRDLAARERVWSEALLDRFTAEPETVAPRTSMQFHGIDDPAERADLIAYLRSIPRP
ncbi:cytochrome c family protein [Microvirga sp. KLBC 81]|uniref:c-type cytochrome n=1 Tax=Microvirga sp. KLBC 81 TaxID=1862707 RepID=UPI000D518C85|nr:c-type cytochrome [Microvirga sp. KLBC 81]PVE22416.1 cytochrome c family protein [Microvirga sp. KLBC 81]